MAVSRKNMDYVQKEISDQRVTFEEMIGRAANFVNGVDVTQKAIIGECNDARARMDDGQRCQRLEDGHRQQDRRR